MQAAVFLDRDGVLNRSTLRDGRPAAPRSLEEFVLLPGAAEAAEKLRAAGYRLIVVTNQPDVATGSLARKTVEEMHARLRQWLPLDDIEVCYHIDEDRCDCRKPKPGMILRAARKWSIDLGRSYLIGDRWRDVSAGKNAGCRTIFIDYGYDEAGPDRPDYVVSSLSEAGAIILQQRGVREVY